MPKKGSCKICDNPVKCGICDQPCKKFCKKHMDKCPGCGLKSKCKCGMDMCDSCRPKPIQSEQCTLAETKVYCPKCCEMLIIDRENPLCIDCLGKYRCWCNNDACEHGF